MADYNKPVPFSKAVADMAVKLRPLEEPEAIDFARRWKECSRVATLPDDQERFRSVCQMIINGESTRSVLVRHNMSFTTYSKVKAELEAQGLVEPFDARFKRALSGAAEASVELLTERVVDGDIDSRALAIAMGIIVDKVAASPPQDVNIHHVVSIDATDISTRLDTMKRAKIIDHGSPSHKQPLNTKALQATGASVSASAQAPIDATFVPEEPKKRAPSLPKSLRKSLKKRGGGGQESTGGGSSDVLPTK